MTPFGFIYFVFLPASVIAMAAVPLAFAWHANRREKRAPVKAVGRFESPYKVHLGAKLTPGT